MTVFSIQDLLVSEVATSVIIDVLEIKLYTQATVRIHFVKSNGEYIKTEFLNISGDDYKKWNDDDGYMVNYIFNKYGIKELNNNVVAENVATHVDVTEPVSIEPSISEPSETEPSTNEEETVITEPSRNEDETVITEPSETNEEETVITDGT